VFKDQLVLLHQASPAPLRPHNVHIERPLRLENRIKKPADCVAPVRLWFRLSVYPSVELQHLLGLKVYCHTVALTGRSAWLRDAQPFATVRNADAGRRKILVGNFSSRALLTGGRVNLDNAASRLRFAKRRCDRLFQHCVEFVLNEGQFTGRLSH
jgi:hypothetical protein